MAIRRTYDPANKDEVFSTLRREILAARLMVTLSGQLHRETSPTVKLLAGMKLPWIVRPTCRADDVANHDSKNLHRKDHIFSTLRREILAARLMVTLDGQLNRETSPTVKSLAGMKLPPIVRPTK